MRRGARFFALFAVASSSLVGGCGLITSVDDLKVNPPSPTDSDAAASTNDGGGINTIVNGDSSASSSATDSGVGGPEEDHFIPPLPDGGCPSTGGPTPVRVTDVNVSFCIDSTEVTRGQYVTFLASNPKLTDLPAVCAWKTGFVPSGNSWPPAATDVDLPIGQVDWCDAVAFCKWSGKQLCGKIGGGPVANPKDTNTSAWLYACSKGGTRIYPYGNAWDPIACNGEDLAANKPVKVATLPKCQGGFDGIYDMSGNQHEIIDSCSTGAAGGPQDDECGMHDGAWDGHGENDLKCASFSTWGRDERSGAVAFRCCSN